MNYIQQGLSSSGDDLIKSTIFEEDEESQSATPNRKAQTEEEDISLPAFPELQYLDISSNLVRIQQLIFFFLFANLLICLLRLTKRTMSWQLRHGQA